MKNTPFHVHVHDLSLVTGEFATEPSKIHSHLNSSILCSNLSESVQTPRQAEAYGTLKEPHNQKLLTSSGVSPQTKSTAV